MRGETRRYEGQVWGCEIWACAPLSPQLIFTRLLLPTLGFVTLRIARALITQLPPVLKLVLYGEASGPSGLHTSDMDRPHSLAPTPATSQNGPPDESRACRECQRRRVKCDGSMPECAVCQRYRRHCLYDKHSRTRLTRKYAGP